MLLTPNQPQTPLIGMVSRLTGQKGFSFLKPALEEILKEDLQFVLLGDGEPGIAEALEKISKSGANNFSFQHEVRQSFGQSHRSRK